MGCFVSCRISTDKCVARSLCHSRATCFYLLTVSRGPRRTTVSNFIKIGRSFAEILRFFKFSRWRPPPFCVLEIAKFYWIFGSRRRSRISMPNFVRIGQSVVKILRFFDFSSWRPSSILDLFGAYLDQVSEYLGVSITLQNLVMIDAVVFII